MIKPTTPSPYSSGTWHSAVRKGTAFCPLTDLCIISMSSLILFFSANYNAVFNFIYIDAEVVPNLAIGCPFWPSLVLIWHISIVILSTFSKRRYKQNIPGLSYYAFPALALKLAVSLRKELWCLLLQRCLPFQAVSAAELGNTKMQTHTHTQSCAHTSAPSFILPGSFHSSSTWFLFSSS